MTRTHALTTATPARARWARIVVVGAAIGACAASIVASPVAAQPADPAYATDPVGSLELLTDPFLQAPTESTVVVAWFTEFTGGLHTVLVGEGVDELSPDQLVAAASGAVTPSGVRRFDAGTSKLSQVAEDSASNVPAEHRPAPAEGVVSRQVWRHEATVTGLTAGERVPYRVVSTDGSGFAGSGTFTLQPLPAPGQDLRIMLTSDHQAMINTPANLQHAAETIGGIDAVFLAGDLVNIPDRASEWFDDTRGSAFFPALQGNGGRTATNGRTYTGGEIIQNAPLFPAVGNHEVQGRRDGMTGLNASFNAPVPRAVAEAAYEAVAAEVNPTGDPAVKERWIVDNSFSTTTYEEIFTLPESSPGGETYYAVTVGDVRLISLYSTRIWRNTTAQPDLAARTSTSRYQEAVANLDDPLAQGYGEHIFEAVDASSEQFAWLADELASDQFAQARFRVVMLHEGPQGLGDNVMPAFTDPVRIEQTDTDGDVIGVRYEYPASQNHLLYDLQPLLENAGVDLVHNGHSHLWNRFRSGNGVTNFLETSNTGNSYGAFHELSGRTRPVPPAPWSPANYWSTGNPGGLAPVVPTEQPHLAADGTPLPFVQSNDHVVFTVLDTGAGEVISYIHDMREPDVAPVVLDRFSLGRPAGAGDGIDLSVTVPRAGEPGELVWSVASDSPIDLGTATRSGDHLAAEGTLHPVTVTDTRATAPAWAVTAYLSDFSSATSTLGGRHLGWTPQLLDAGGGAVAGPVVGSGRVTGDGLSAASVLGSAPAGHPVGSATLGAQLRLELPVETGAGRYTSTLTLTAIG